MDLVGERLYVDADLLSQYFFQGNIAILNHYQDYDTIICNTRA